MKFGVMYDFRNPRGAWWKPYPKLLREFLDQIVAVEGMGYENVWVTEHHFVEDDYNPSVMTAMAGDRCAYGANRDRLVRDADAVSGSGAYRRGWGLRGQLVQRTPGAWSGTGLPDRRILRVLRIRGPNVCTDGRGYTAGRPAVDRRGGHFRRQVQRVKNVTISPRPVQKPRPPIWIGARAEKAVRRAAKNGYNLMATIGPDPAIPYRAALREFGRNPDDYSIAQLRMVYVAKNSAKPGTIPRSISTT